MSYAIRKDGQGWRAVNGIDDCTVDETFSETQPAPKVPTLAELKQSQLIKINADFEVAIKQTVSGYPSDEISSWAKQETEARAYQASNAAATPLLDALATARGITKAELATRIIAKADLFAAASGQLIGKRQGLEDKLNALAANATPADVAAIVW